MREGMAWPNFQTRPLPMRRAGILPCRVGYTILFYRPDLDRRLQVGRNLPPGRAGNQLPPPEGAV